MKAKNFCCSSITNFSAYTVCVCSLLCDPLVICWVFKKYLKENLVWRKYYAQQGKPKIFLEARVNVYFNMIVAFFFSNMTLYYSFVHFSIESEDKQCKVETTNHIAVISGDGQHNLKVWATTVWLPPWMFFFFLLVILLLSFFLVSIPFARRPPIIPCSFPSAQLPSAFISPSSAHPSPSRITLPVLAVQLIACKVHSVSGLMQFK